MLETSKDFLYWAISISVIVMTFFICWAAFYIVMMLKKAHSALTMVTEFLASLKEKMARVEELLKTIEDKIKHSASYLPLVLKGITDLMGFVKRKREEKASRKKSK